MLVLAMLVLAMLVLVMLVLAMLVSMVELLLPTLLLAMPLPILRMEPPTLPMLACAPTTWEPRFLARSIIFFFTKNYQSTWDCITRN